MATVTATADPKTSTRQRRVNVLEFTQANPNGVDRAAGIIRGVKILGFISRNGQRYSREAVERATRLYEGATVNIDHPRNPESERSMSDQFGWLERVHAAPDGLRGDLHYIKSHSMAGPVTELAERRPDKLGLSHNAVCLESVGRDGVAVYTGIQRVRSVDLVCNPATVRSLFESVAGDGGEAAGPVATFWELFVAETKRVFDDPKLKPAAKATAISRLARLIFTSEEAVASGADEAADGESGGQTEADAAQSEAAALESVRRGRRVQSARLDRQELFRLADRVFPGGWNR